MSNRAELISQLAASMGAGKAGNRTSTNTTGASKSRYNAKTGTLYCKQYNVSQSTANQSLAYFIGMKEKYSRNNSLQAQQLIQIYQCAIDAIKMTQDPNVKAALKALEPKKAAI